MDRDDGDCTRGWLVAVAAEEVAEDPAESLPEEVAHHDAGVCLGDVAAAWTIRPDDLGAPDDDVALPIWDERLENERLRIAEATTAPVIPELEAWATEWCTATSEYMQATELEDFGTPPSEDLVRAHVGAHHTYADALRDMDAPPSGDESAWRALRASVHGLTEEISDAGSEPAYPDPTFG